MKIRLNVVDDAEGRNGKRQRWEFETGGYRGPDLYGEVASLDGVDRNSACLTASYSGRRDLDAGATVKFLWAPPVLGAKAVTPLAG